MEMIFYTPCQVAEIIGVQLQTVYAMIQDGRLQAANISSEGRPSYRISKENLEFMMSVKPNMKQTD